MAIFRQLGRHREYPLPGNPVKHLFPKEKILFKDSEQTECPRGQWLLSEVTAP